ncbi:Stp1/IreP family PP2C-type Ser/Thr phosphatase [Alkalihalobacterium chitinilyticum]|uniref:Stp1/IreP family PP2C-type Ser/Thr phosphatase n=1 Tax=Alkalihalobacterium chitinilyticum TaxID=2980103 RepID=A0ABT5VC35_9BACI|nr:Stp1/IreP family PP2C-type Ser/Thr phosphatase [Alkalihalobacterium chitinilyticum]MDE5413016.1 Stp1/IreP family PP2C-type Ser/Thr phosphatase [Alkalihalobacterium chitinilyticum]
MKFAFNSNVGKVRPHNEDSGGIFLHPNGAVLAVVADGMGGHQAGDVASQMTSDLLKEKWLRTAELSKPTDIEQWLNEAIQDVNEKLFLHSKEHRECQGMGTTVVIAVCTEELVSIGHVGDSRGYLQNNCGFQQKTSDHSLVNELVRTGQITEEQAEHHPRKNVLLRALGTEPTIKMDIETIDWEEGNTIILCSDGLSNKVTDNEIEDILRLNDNVNQKVDKLINLANDRGGEDNITVAIVHYSHDRQEQE